MRSTDSGHCLLNRPPSNLEICQSLKSRCDFGLGLPGNTHGGASRLDMSYVHDLCHDCLHGGSGSFVVTQHLLQDRNIVVIGRAYSNHKPR